MTEPLRVLLVGVGNMGRSHGRAYDSIDEFEIVGVVEKLAGRHALPEEFASAPVFENFDVALAETRPDVVSVCSYVDTHAQFAIAAMEADCHVFVESPIAGTVEEARQMIDTARRTGRKLLVGHILLQHPAWESLIELCGGLGKPLVMRMNLNQQSFGMAWTTHKNLMKYTTPIVDCGVHYIQIMCHLTRSKPVRVHGIGARLSNEVEQQNYGQFQVVFEDGSVGWFEAGWGPMVSEIAYFVKDVWGPGGSVGIAYRPGVATAGDSADLNRHTSTGSLVLHHSELDESGHFPTPDEWLYANNEPTHLELCHRQQALLLRAIREDIDLSEHMEETVMSLAIVLAAQKSCEQGRVIDL